MSATNSTENTALDAILDSVTVYISLHTASPGETGTQATSETSYTGYARQSTTLTITGSEAANASQINFPQCTGNLETLTHFGIGTASSGTGSLLFYGELGESITLLNLMTPVFEAGNLSVVCD